MAPSWLGKALAAVAAASALAGTGSAAESGSPVAAAPALEHAVVGGVVASSSAAAAASVRPVEVPLRRSVNERQRSTLLMALKEQQSAYASLVEVGDVPLKEEILAQKHLATYFGTIRVGPDNAEFRVLMDTGSSEFWVPSSECTSDICRRHKRYPRHGDEKKLAHVMDVKYLSGSLKGDMIYSTVKLGDVEVPHQVVGLGRVVDIDLLRDVEWDGILGLAYPNPSLTRDGVLPLFDNIINNKVLKNRGLSNQFAYYLDDQGGAVTLGGANCDLLHDREDKQTCIDSFKFVPVTERTYWTVQLKDVTVKYPGDAAPLSGFCPAGGCKAIVDTGTYLIYGPQDQVSRMMRSPLDGCGSHKNMPDFTFHFEVGDGEPVAITLRPVDYILKFEVSGREDCVVSISPDQDTIWTLGQSFLRSVYTVFDRDSDRIGFARLPRKGFHAINEAERANMDKRHNSPANDKRKHSGSGGGGGGGKSFIEERDTATVEPVILSPEMHRYAQLALDEDDMPASDHWSHF